MYDEQDLTAKEDRSSIRPICRHAVIGIDLNHSFAVFFRLLVYAWSLTALV
jgi:hypothetical protein